MRTPRTVRWARRTISWSLGIGLFTVLLGAWKVGVWANHWYIAEHFYYVDVNEAAKTGPYWDITQLLRSGNESLLEGFVYLGIAAICFGLFAVLSRRHPR
ncbi:hypothetical protein [Pengzhenrongella phosphoraccumulans]|uniref:hypothetical protein n=1 Tax=Pengzhenrongella phosphoraccumulans TaxID=3114394 RepID=UPI00388D0EB2